MSERSEIRMHAFGRPCHFIIDDDAARGKQLLTECEKKILELERKFSAYQSDSIVSRINQFAGTDYTVPLDAEASSLFRFANALWVETKHIFDPTARVLSQCYRSDGSLDVNSEQIRNLLDLVGWQHLQISSAGARLTRPGMLLDLNSCVRPYVLDSLCKFLKQQSVTAAFLEIDQDVVTIGKQASGANWLVGARIPKGARASIVRFKVNHQGFSIRGDFEHTVTQGDEIFGRVLSPVDGLPVPGLLSVAVLAENCLTAYSAACTARLRAEFMGLKWLERLGLPWLAVDRQLVCHGPLAPAN